MKALWELLNAQAGWLFALGVGVVLAWHVLKRRDDRTLAMHLRAQKRASVQLGPGPKVSVLVAAWNEVGGIAEHISSFLRLSYPNRELILCAGGDDGTYAAASQYADEQVIVLQQQRGEGKQRALQRCLDCASGEVIFLTDADCLLDDESFARTLAPVRLEAEQVATGTSRPLRQQLGNPFVVHQWCTNLFVDARRPEFTSGILGRNCALTREALQQIGGFGAQVHTGTDYHMAKLLLQHSYRIRYVRDSAVETRYPETFRSYWRRQSRWVRNLMVHGPSFGAYDELGMALRTSVAGWAMLLLPLASLIVGPIALALWGILFVHACLAKLRFARFAHGHQGVEISWRQYACTPLYVFVDLIAWSVPLLDLLSQRHRW